MVLLDLTLTLSACNGVIDDVYYYSQINEFQHENEERVWWVEFFPDDSKIISGGDDTIIVRDPISGDEIFDFTRHGERANQATFTSGGSRVASTEGDLGGGTTIDWETATGDIISEFEHDGFIKIWEWAD